MHLTVTFMGSRRSALTWSQVMSRPDIFSPSRFSLAMIASRLACASMRTSVSGWGSRIACAWQVFEEGRRGVGGEGSTSGGRRVGWHRGL